MSVRSSLVCCLEKFSIFAWFCVFICSVVCLFHAMQSYCNLQAPRHREQHFIIGGFVGKQHFSPSIERKAYTPHEKAATPHLINCAHFYIAVYSIPPLSYRIVSIHLEELWFIVVYTNIVRKRVPSKTHTTLFMIAVNKNEKCVEQPDHWHGGVDSSAVFQWKIS